MLEPDFFELLGLFVIKTPPSLWSFADAFHARTLFFQRPESDFDLLELESWVRLLGESDIASSSTCDLAGHI